MVTKNVTYKKSFLYIAICVMLAMFIAGCTQTMPEEEILEDEIIENEIVIDITEDGLVIDGSEGEMADEDNDDLNEESTNELADEQENTSEDDLIMCAMDVQECPDGSFVARNPEDNCNFYPCPEVEY
jgi:hypothetical protein